MARNFLSFLIYRLERKRQGLRADRALNNLDRDFLEITFLFEDRDLVL